MKSFHGEEDDGRQSPQATMIEGRNAHYPSGNGGTRQIYNC